MIFQKNNDGSGGSDRSEDGEEPRDRPNQSRKSRHTRVRSSEQPGGVPGYAHHTRALEIVRVVALVTGITMLVAVGMFGVSVIGAADDMSEFDGEIEFVGTEATDGSSWEYQIDDLDSVDNFELNLEGHRVSEDRSTSTTTESETLEIEPRGTVDPEDAKMTLTGQRDETDGSTDGTAEDGDSITVDVGGNTDPKETEVMFTGVTETDTNTLSGSASDGDSTSISVAGNVQPESGSVSVDRDSHEETWADEDDFEVQSTDGEGSSDSDTVDVPDRFDAITEFYFYIVPGSGEGYLELEIDGESMGEKYVDDSDYYHWDGGKVDVSETSEVTVTVTVISGDPFIQTSIDNGGGIIQEPSPVTIADDTGTTTSISSGSTSSSFRPDTDASEVDFEVDYGDIDYNIEFEQKWKSENPELSIGGSTASYSGLLDDGETTTETINLDDGSNTGAISLDHSAVDYNISWVEIKQTENPSIDLGGDSLYHSGILDDGETIEDDVYLDRNEVHEADVQSDGPVKADVEWTDVSLTRDPEISINDETVGVDGILSDGETNTMDVSESWIEEGTNTIDVSLADANGGPSPQVSVDYRHDAATLSTAKVNSTTWHENVEVSREFASDQEGVDARLPMPDNVVGVDDLEIRRNGGEWQSVPSEEYDLDGTDLVVLVGDVDEGESVSVRADAEKIRMQGGEIEVVEPTTEGSTLATRMRVVDDAGTDPVAIEVSETVDADRVHYLTGSDWESSESVRVTDSGEQTLRLPNAVEDAESTVGTAPLTVSPVTGEATVELDDPAEPRFSIGPGSTPGDTVEVGYHNTTSGQYYELVSIDDDRVVDSGTASSPVWFDVDDDETTYVIQEGEPSSTVAGPTSDTGDSSTIGGPLLILASLGGMLGTVVVGRRAGLGNWILAPATIVVVAIAAELSTPRSLFATISGDLLHGTSGPLMALLGTAVALGLIWSIDSRTRRSIPTTVYAVIAGGGMMWLITSVLADSADEVIPVVLGVSIMVATVLLDQRTEMEIPRPVLGGVGLIAIIWIVETIAEGMIREPLMDGLGEVAPLVIMSGLAVGVLLIRRWLQP